MREDMAMKEKVLDLRRTPKDRPVPHKPPCWLVWSLQTSGLTQLRAIDTSAGTAAKHAKACRYDEDRVIKAWVEQRDMNHLYGHNDITTYQMTDRKELYRIAEKLRASEI
jgi:hypothetical protein